MMNHNPPPSVRQCCCPFSFFCLLRNRVREEILQIVIHQSDSVDFGVSTIFKNKLTKQGIKYFTNYRTFRSSRKAWLLIPNFALHSSFLLSFFKEAREKGKIITKLVVKIYAFLNYWTFSFIPTCIIRYSTKLKL